uniref:response regulator n=1 Tax=Castellaniella defragrans TaxID=75697 RepID=UPI0033400949
MAAAHILIVDDDAITRECLANYFRSEDYDPLEAATAEQAEALLASEDITLVLLDIRLPGKDGLTLARELRVRSEVGIILVTTRQDEVDRLIGLECGADDYITKPFNPREILARAKNLIHRVRLCTQARDAERNIQPQLLRFPRWSLDTRQRMLHNRAGETIPLTSTEYRMLQTFIARPGRPLSRDEIMDTLRNREYSPTDRSIDVMVSRLRRKLADNPNSPQIITTIHGEGYQFNEYMG